VNLETDYILKYIIIGDICVGKSSIMLQFTEKHFPKTHETTIGVGYGKRDVTIENNKLKIIIWDTAGQERYKSLIRSYYRDTCCVILVYDITNRETFISINKWLSDVHYLTNNPVIILVGNKSDLNDQRSVSYDEGAEFAEKHNILFLEVSAQSGNSIDKVFTDTATNVMKTINNSQITCPGIQVCQKYKPQYIGSISTPDNGDCC
jgi:Ras-related protein Rab-2A